MLIPALTASPIKDDPNTPICMECFLHDGLHDGQNHIGFENHQNLKLIFEKNA